MQNIIDYNNVWSKIPTAFQTRSRRTCDTISIMATGTGTITEIRLEPDGLSGRIVCPSGLRPAPGQYLFATSPDPSDPLPVVLFPGGVDSLSGPFNGEVELRVAPPLPTGWSAGMELPLRGPLGNGFRLPATARRVAISSPDGTPFRLLPLVSQALEQRASVAIYTRSVPVGLPEEVEVLPLDLLPEAAAWADFLALDSSLAGLPALRQRLGLKPYQRPGCLVQVLVTTAMPCGGVAECGACAVATRDGWALACLDGPVFDLSQLEGA